MNLASRSLCRAGLLTALAAAVFTFAAGPKKVTPPPPAPPPAPASARPTVTLQASPTSVNKGDSSALSGIPPTPHSSPSRPKLAT